MAESGNGTARWIIQIFITIALAALAAFGGVQVGAGRMEATQIAMEKRLDRLEGKLDRILDARREPQPR